jgi:AraC-like DNA-binding protein
MAILQSVRPSQALRPYVRIYAQRQFDFRDLAVVEPVPAQLEQVLNFEIGTMPGIRHRQFAVSSAIWIGGSQTSFPGRMYLYPGVESFAIFFHPTGWSRLFGIPPREITNRIGNAEFVHGSIIRYLWNQLGEAQSFEERVRVVEEFLLIRASGANIFDKIEIASSLLFRTYGSARISELARESGLSLRQFERLFLNTFGMSPKVFARVARFQAAVDAKVECPKRTWLDIAHSFGYYDQMHMVHDFESLACDTPTQLISEMGDVRPGTLGSAY